MDSTKLREINNSLNYSVQYIDVNNDSKFMKLAPGLVNPPTIKLRRCIDLTNVCEKNKEGVLSGAEFTTAELEAILSDNSRDNGTNRALEVSPINTSLLASSSSSGSSVQVSDDCVQYSFIDNNNMITDKNQINLNQPIYIDALDQDDAGIVIETDIAGTVEIGTDHFIEAGESFINVNSDETRNFVKEIKIKATKSKLKFKTDHALILNETNDNNSSNSNNNNNVTFSEEEFKLIESLTNQENKKSQYYNSVHTYNQSKNYEILKAAKSLYSKRTRTLWHWIDPAIPKTKLKSTVLLAWDNLPAWQKQIYISQVLGKFSVDVVTPMVNPQLAGISVSPTSNKMDSSPNLKHTTKRKMFVHKSSQKWTNNCFKSKKKGSIEINSENTFS